MLGVKKRTMAIVLAALLAVAGVFALTANSVRGYASGVGSDTTYHGWSHTLRVGEYTNFYYTFYLTGDTTQQSYLAYCFSPGDQNPGLDNYMTANLQEVPGKGTEGYTYKGDANLTAAAKKVLWNGYPLDGSGQLANMEGSVDEKRWATFVAMSVAQGTISDANNYLNGLPNAKAIYNWLIDPAREEAPVGVGGAIYGTSQTAHLVDHNKNYQDLIVPTINVPVAKAWSSPSGELPSSVTVTLYANGIDTGKTVTLSSSNSWKNTFQDLAVADKDGNVISYTIKEDAVAGYTTSGLSGDYKTGFTFTNIGTTPTPGPEPEPGVEPEPEPEPEEGNVTIKKVDENSQVLAGATLHIEDANGNIVVPAWVSTGEEVKFTLPAGTYYLVEDEAPEGYEKAGKKEFKVEVTEGGSSAAGISPTADANGKPLPLPGVNYSNIAQPLQNTRLTLDTGKVDSFGLGTTAFSGSDKNGVSMPAGVPVYCMEPSIGVHTNDYQVLEFSSRYFEAFLSTAVNQGYYGGRYPDPDALLRVAYVGASGDGKGYSSRATDYTEFVRATQQAIWKVSANVDPSFRDSDTQQYRDLVSTLIAAASDSSLDAEMPDHYVFWLNQRNGSTGQYSQPFMVATFGNPSNVTPPVEPQPVTVELVNKKVTTGEVTISKTDATTGQELPGATLIVTDANGVEVARWISTSEPTKITLAPGTYTLTELTAPQGYEVAESITFTVGTDGQVVGGKVEMKDKPTPTVPEEKQPSIGTTATYGTTDAHEGPANKSVTIKDVVAYQNLEGSAEYTLFAQLRNKADGSAVDGTIISKTFTADASGNGTVEMEFTLDASKLEGKSVVAFEILAQTNAETMLPTVVALHEDINDAGQTVTFTTTTDEPTEGKIGTTVEGASDSAAANLTAEEAAAKTSLVDTIDYEGLVGGAIYKVSGRLMENGTTEVVTATAECKADASGKGSWQITFTFPAGTLKADTKYVVFEKAEQQVAEGSTDEPQVLTHEDPDDQSQTVVVGPGTPGTDEPTEGSIGTTVEGASDSAAANLTAEEAAAKTSLVDTIDYEGLVGGASYMVSGRLMENGTTEVATATAVCSADASGKGSWQITFTFPAGTLKADTRYVVFEKAEQVMPAGSTNEPQVLTHEDPNDQSQTVVVAPTPNTPENEPNEGSMRTTVRGATASSAAALVANADGKITTDVVDTIDYEGLSAGATYTVTGTLMEDGVKEIATVSEDKVAETTDGTWTITFKNVTLQAGKKYVVFEEAVNKNNDQDKAEHKDANDQAQTIVVKEPKPTPEPGTADLATTVEGATANEASSLTAADAAAKTSVVDKIDYQGLEGGKTYKVTGRLMENGTTEVAQAQAELVADASGTGTWNLTITFPAGTLKADTKYVVFEKAEKVTQGDDEPQVITHEDADDTAQTVVVAPTPDTPGNEPNEGSMKTTVKGATTSSAATLVANADGTITTDVVDTIDYKGLSAGATYTVTGTLMEDGTTAVATVSEEKVAETTNGSWTITFKNVTLQAGKKYVVFEEAVNKNNDQDKAEHKDANDQAQTTIVEPYTPTDSGTEEPGGDNPGGDNPGGDTPGGDNPGGDTPGGDTPGGDNPGEGNSIAIATEANFSVISGITYGDSAPYRASVISDKVTYTNLEAGKTYTLVGALMDKATGRAIDTSLYTMKATTFTPNSANGTEYVNFYLHDDFNTQYKDKEVVVFEKLYEGNSTDGTPVATHEDITDKAQTVVVKHVNNGNTEEPGDNPGGNGDTPGNNDTPGGDTPGGDTPGNNDTPGGNTDDNDGKTDVPINSNEGNEVTVVDKDGNVIDQWTSDGTNHNVPLGPGEYTIVVTDKDGKKVEKTIVVDENGKITDKNGNPILVDGNNPLKVNTTDTTPNRTYGSTPVSGSTVAGTAPAKTGDNAAALVASLIALAALGTGAATLARRRVKQ